MPLEVLSAQDAFANLRSNKHSRWPDGRSASEGRLGAFAALTIKPTFRFDVQDSILTIGSCFAREIEACLLRLGFDVPLASVDIPREERVSEKANAILNKYVAPAMANELRWAFDPDAVFPENSYLQVGDGLWHDPHLAANMKPASLDRVKERRQHVIDTYRKARGARIVVVTLGLVEAWFDRETGLYLNDTPPGRAMLAYPGRFEMHVLSYEDILRSLEDIISILRRFGHPEFRMLLTVSPVPFKATFTGADAMQANMYSKSVLRAAAEAFSRSHSDIVNYFPSFETVVLGDRAMSYHIDNIHVREQVVARIMAQVVRNYTDQQLPELPATPVERADSAEVPTARSLHRQAKQLAASGDYVAAAQMMRSAVESFGTDPMVAGRPEFHRDFGNWLLRSRQPALAEQSLRNAVRLAPDHHRAQFRLGLTLMQLKRREEALACLRTAASLDPGNSAYQWRLGQAQMALKQFDAARASFARAAQAGHPKALGALRDLERRA